MHLKLDCLWLFDFCKEGIEELLLLLHELSQLIIEPCFLLLSGFKCFFFSDLIFKEPLLQMFRIDGEIPSNDRYATLTREQRGNIDLTQPGYVLGTGDRVEAPLSTNPDSVRQDFMTFEAARIQRINDPNAIF